MNLVIWDIYVFVCMSLCVIVCVCNMCVWIGINFEEVALSKFKYIEITRFTITIPNMYIRQTQPMGNY